MELKEFVKEALVQITEGVKESQEAIRDNGGIVNPAIRLHNSTDQSHVSSLSDGQNIYTVAFDIAVSVTESNNGSAGGKLMIASAISLGASKDRSEMNSTVSKIAFKVPLALPVDAISLQTLQTEDVLAMVD